MTQRPKTPEFSEFRSSLLFFRIFTHRRGNIFLTFALLRLEQPSKRPNLRAMSFENAGKRDASIGKGSTMRLCMAWLLVAVGAWITTGCKTKSAQSSIERMVADSKLDSTPADQAAPESTQGDAPATFHPGKKTKPERHASKASSASISTNGKYVVQVLVFQTRKRAEALAGKLTDLGFPAYVAEVENPTPELSGTYYRVRIGSFSTREEAAAFGGERLKPQGFDYWVDAKANDHTGAGSSTVTEPRPVPVPVSTPAPAYTPPPRAVAPAPTPAPVPAPVAAPAPHPTPAPVATPAASMRDTEPVKAVSKPAPTPVAAPASSMRSSRPAPPTPATEPVATPAPVQKISTPVATPATSQSAVAAPAAPRAIDPVPFPHATPTRDSALIQKDPMRSPFEREGYYRPVDTQSTPSDSTPPNTHRTLPTW